jgi:hypothetical protein
MKHPIPREALDDRLGFIGTSGSGKTYNAGTAIEILLAHRARAVIIDPLGVWWGLRLLADGKTPSKFDVVIFGGDHADLPLNEHAGALIGETAANMAESCIIDLSKMPSRAAERRFMTAFLETIYRKAGGEPFHLIVDEADLFAPQKPQAGDEVLLGHMENIVRRGRVRGFIPWLISQRPAVLNKNVLSQVDGLLAFKLTSVQDRDALDAWIEGQADKAQGKEIKDSLPTFPIGEGIVWLPGHGILARKAFPQKVTFDSSRKPKRGEKLKSRKLKPVNVDKLKTQLAEFVEQQKASDVPTLRKRIRELEAVANKASPAPAAKPDKDVIAAARKQGFDQAERKLKAAMEREVQKRTVELLSGLGDRVGPLMAFLGEQVRAAKAQTTNLEIQFDPGPQQQPAKAAPAPVRAAATAPRARKPSPDAGGDGRLTNPQAHLMRALAWWDAMAHPQPTRAQLAAIAGWKVGGSNMRGRLAELSTAGLVHYPSSGTIAMTEAGRAAAPAPDTSTTLVDSIRSMLTNPQRLLFDKLLETGAAPVDRETVAAGINWEAGGSNMRGRLAELSALEVIYYPGKGQVALQDWVVA